MLLPRNTQRLPVMTASTLLQLLKPRLLSLSEHLGCIMQIFPHRDVDTWGCVWISRFRGVWQSLDFYKEYLWFWDLKVSAHGVWHFCMRFFHIRNTKNLSHTETLHTESRCVLINPLRNFLQKDSKESIEDDFVVLSIKNKQRKAGSIGSIQS